MTESEGILEKGNKERELNFCVNIIILFYLSSKYFMDWQGIEW